MDWEGLHEESQMLVQRVCPLCARAECFMLQEGFACEWHCKLAVLQCQESVNVQ